MSPNRDKGCIAEKTTKLSAVQPLVEEGLPAHPPLTMTDVLDGKMRQTYEKLVSADPSMRHNLFSSLEAGRSSSTRRTPNIKKEWFKKGCGTAF